MGNIKKTIKRQCHAHRTMEGGIRCILHLSADGGMLKNAAIALGLAVFLGIFSQVPIGNEDLQNYQDYKCSASRIDLGDLNDARMQ